MRTKTGIITSNRMAKTLVVKVDSYVSHPKYRKRFRVSKKFYVHTEDTEQFKVGDTVSIAETRPVSKLKRWKVVA